MAQRTQEHHTYTAEYYDGDTAGDGRGEVKIPAFDLVRVRHGLCVNTDGSKRVLRHAIPNERIANALRPIITFPCPFMPNLDDFSTMFVCNGAVGLPNDLALKIASFLGDADDLDALSETSRGFRAVARAAIDSLLRPWLTSQHARQWSEQFCPRSLARTFQRIQHARIEYLRSWDAILWQSAALGCIHGIYLALEQKASVDGYSGGRKNAEGPALWCASKFNHLEAVKLLCEVGHSNLEARGGIRTKSSPLWVAAREGNTAIIQYLISIGADPTSKHINGRGSSVSRMALIAMNKGYGSTLAEMVETIELINARATAW